MPITTDEQALIASCLAAVDDAAPWLVYGDWLRDHGRYGEVGEVAPIRVFVRSLPAIPARCRGRTLASVADWLASVAGYADGAVCHLPPVLPHLRPRKRPPLPIGGPWLGDIDGECEQPEIELFPTLTGGPPPPLPVPSQPATRRRRQEPPMEQMDWLAEPGWR